MSGFKRFFIIMALFLAVSVSILLAAAFSFTYEKTDTVKINDLARSAAENWNDLQVLEDRAEDTEFLIFDGGNRIKFSTSYQGFDSIRSPLDAASEGFICIPVTDDGRFLGTLVIPDPLRDGYSSLKSRIIIMVFLIMIVILVSYLSFWIYINRNIIRPFERMKSFAGLIAQGRLDEPLIMDRDNVFGAFTESFDIMREELKAARGRETALRMREKELIASLSHDLKTPVTGIRVICELLEVKVEDGYVKGKIENIGQKTREIDTLISDLLSSTLEELGQMNVSVSDIPSAALDEIVKEHDVRKKVSDSKAPECLICVDRSRLSQVIGNIITNSYKYADTVIDVSYRFEDSFLKMTIRDHGAGVDPEEIDLVTNKFYRGKTNARGKEGSGLGLYISSELMKKMGGRLICGTSGEGFEVSLLIPLS